MEIIIQLIPFLIVSLVFVWFAYGLCRRKGRDAVYAWLCLVPFVQFFVLLWLASLPDQAVLERLYALEKRST